MRVVALLLLFCLFASGCGKHGTAAPQGGSDVPPSKVNLKRNVDLGRAEQRALVYSVDMVGSIEAEGQTDIAAGVIGVVDEVLFREGDKVTVDTVLLKVDQRRYESAAKLAEANVVKAEAQLALAADFDRRAQRSGLGASSEEKAKAILGLASAKAELESARAAQDIARNNLDRSRVRAPYTGVINQRRVTRGSFLEDKSVIATMADLSHLRLVGWVPESAAPLVRELMDQQNRRVDAVRQTLPLCGWLAPAGPWGTLVGQLLIDKKDVPSGFDPEFTLLAFPRRTFRARVFYISSVASPETRMFECKAEVETTNLDVELRPGYTARIRAPIRSNPRACVIPEEAVRASERGFIAFVPVLNTGRDGMPEWIARAVTLDPGFRSPGWVEVRNGIDPGQWIVRRGAEALEDGTPIRFVEPPDFGK